jgi:hypothetical protein
MVKFVVYVGQRVILNISLVYEILSKMITNTPLEGVCVNFYIQQKKISDVTIAPICIGAQH